LEVDRGRAGRGKTLNRGKKMHGQKSSQKSRKNNKRIGERATEVLPLKTWQQKEDPFISERVETQGKKRGWGCFV